MTNYCSECKGETVSCECAEGTASDDFAPEYLAEDIDDRFVVWTVNDSGVGRIEVTR